MRFTPSFLHGFVTLFTWLTKKCCEAFLQEMHREVLIGAKQGNSVPGLLLHYITALVIPTTKHAISKRLTSDKQKARLLIAQGAEAISAKVTSDKRVRCERYPR